MARKLLKHPKQAKHGRFYRATERFYETVIAHYGTHAAMGAEAPDHHAVGYGRHAGAHAVPLHHGSQRFLPGAGYRSDSGYFRGPRVHFFSAMAEAQQELGKMILQDPAVASLSSFIGIDGTNTTPNSGRIQINLKPHDDRSSTASDVIRRLQPELAQVEGIILYMQPVQDLTVEDRVSRTQFQYSLEDADAAELNDWSNAL